MTHPSFMNKRMKEYCCSASEKIFHDLEIPESGMTDEKAQELRKKYGKNYVGRAKGEWKERNICNLICRSFLNPFSVTSENRLSRNLKSSEFPFDKKKTRKTAHTAIITNAATLPFANLLFSIFVTMC